MSLTTQIPKVGLEQSTQCHIKGNNPHKWAASICGATSHPLHGFKHAERHSIIISLFSYNLGEASAQPLPLRGKEEGEALCGHLRASKGMLRGVVLACGVADLN